MRNISSLATLVILCVAVGSASGSNGRRPMQHRGTTNFEAQKQRFAASKRGGPRKVFTGPRAQTSKKAPARTASASASKTVTSAAKAAAPVATPAPRVEPVLAAQVEETEVEAAQVAARPSRWRSFFSAIGLGRLFN